MPALIPYDLAGAIDHAAEVLNRIAARCEEEGYALRVVERPGRSPAFAVAAVREVYAAGDSLPALESE